MWDLFAEYWGMGLAIVAMLWLGRWLGRHGHGGSVKSAAWYYWFLK